MSTSPERYRLYLDESGDHVFHNETRLAEPGHRYLALVGCWFSQGASYLRFHRELEDLKQRHFPHSPDEPVILHRKEIINRKGAFWRLRDDRARAAFDDDLCALVEKTGFALVGICIDKRRMGELYTRPIHPYSLGLGFLLQRYCGWLNHMNRSGDLLAESRGREEDRRFRAAYSAIWSFGDPFQWNKPEFFQRALTSKQAKLKKKSDNIAGLQLADLLARALRDDILAEFGQLAESIAPFDQRLANVVQAKYDRRLYDGRVLGYGKVLFPK